MGSAPHERGAPRRGFSRLDELAERALERRAALGLLRSREARTIDGAPGPRVEIRGRTLINFASNAYLGLGTHPRVVEAAIRACRETGVSSTASRLISGNLEATSALERALAALKGTEDALVFSSGYLANLGVTFALGRALDPDAPPPVFLSDALNHASLIDGCRLARADVEIFRHADARDARERATRAQREGRRAVILTESRFSMDGDVAPLAELADVAEETGAALVVDEAHATGVDGEGRGLVHALGLTEKVDVLVGTLGKALGAHGAFVAGSRVLTRWLENAARAFVFTTGLPGPIAAGARAAIEVLLEERPDLALRRNVATTRSALAARGLLSLVPETATGPILPIVLGENEAVVEVAQRLEAEGLLVGAIRPPTVPPGTARLRVTLRADHGPEDLEALADALARADLRPRRAHRAPHEPSALAREPT